MSKRPSKALPAETSNPLDDIVTRSLLYCLRRELPPEAREEIATLSADNWESLVSLSGAHGVFPLLYHRLKQHDLLGLLPPHVHTKLRNSYLSNAVANVRRYEVLAEILHGLADRGIPVILLKGAALAEFVYGNIELRAMSDLDLLIHRDQIDEAYAFVIALGYAPYSPGGVENWTAAHRHAPLLSKTGSTHVELHWSITQPDTSTSVNPEELWSRARPVTISGVKTLIPASEDLLLHLCYHLSYQDQFECGLRPLADVSEVIFHHDERLDWSLVIRQTIEWQWVRGVYVALRLARELVGTDVPLWVFHSLMPGDLNGKIIDLVRILTLNSLADKAPIPSGLAYLMSASGFSDKVCVFLAGVFLPPKQMALKYPVDPTSPRILLYYLVRLVHLTSHYACLAWRMWRGDTHLVGLAQRKAAIQHWLRTT